MMADDNKEENKQPNDRANISKTYADIQFNKVEDQYTVMVEYHSNAELLSLQLINQTTKNVYKQDFDKENVHKITDGCKLKPHLVVKMIIDTLASKELTSKNVRMFLLPNIKQASAKYDEIRSFEGVPDAVIIPTRFQPKLHTNNEHNELENCLLFVLHFSAPPYIFFNYCFIVKEKDISDNDKLKMRMNDLQKENQSLKNTIKELINTVNTQQQQIDRSVQSNNTNSQRLQQLRTDLKNQANTQTNAVQTQQQKIDQLVQSNNTNSNNYNAVNQRLQQLRTDLGNQENTQTNAVQTQQQQITQLSQQLQPLLDERKVSEPDVRFDRFDSRYIGIEANGKKIKTIGHECTYVCTYSSTGFNSGIRKWKIKITAIAHGSTEYVGVVTTIYNGQQCYSKQICTDGGISSGTGLANGDIVAIELNFTTLKITMLKNGNALKTANIVGGQTYYPTIQICACQNQIVEVV